ncbi:hypothetical protein OBBRIDRAFT_719775 [Obba rivulosa]|uniref:DUF6697 domain-containing protein n=1 Tax=Obba rivulosa TaxID=1052685 RepID=A0A8E2DU01_9APHY|nr:hypothetical protein OBBRIDRAFT_719775 [Obba rivulosa]
MNHNPWSPVAPGEHGYMMVGLGREKETFMEPEIRHIFVGCESSHQYAGLYSCVRVEPLTKEEWFILPEHVKTTYVETTRDKEKRLNPGPTSKVRAEYDTGERRAPCVMLQCIEFNPEFYNELVAANDNFFAPCTTSPSKLKRARPAEDEAGEANSNTISPGSSTKRANTSMASSASPQRKSSRVSVRIIMPDYVEH